MYINISKVDFGRCYSGSGGGEVVDLDYMTLSALGDGNITITIPDIVDSSHATSLSYSKDKSNWTETVVDNTEQTITIPVTSGENVYLKGVAMTWCNADEEYGASIDSSANINASGNIMSLLYGDNFKDKTSFPEGSQYTLSGLFSGNICLISAENLIIPAATLTDYCYSSMFWGCSSLSTAPELPATTLAMGCYGSMFQNCSSLTTAPELPATTLAMGCYGYMFQNCSSLTTAPELPATTLAQSCYNSMFKGCTSLTTAPELPAAALDITCYTSMFNGCTSLTTAPELPATTLVDSCYSGMFNGCTSLTTVTELPATTLANYCYSNMFQDCTSLITAPELPATTLSQYCYSNMFQGCTSLTTAPELHVTTLAPHCYSSMFMNCTSLTTAPELPATTLANYCYSYMFNGCTSLNNITMLATDISAKNCLNQWVVNVSSTGTFNKAASMTSLPTGVNGVPSGWTVKDYGVIDYSSEYMTLSALGDGEITITIPAAINSSYATSLSYSKDKSNWTDTIIDDTAQTITIPVTSGDNVYLKGIAKQLGNSSTGVNINSNADINASGNIMSLLYGDDYKDKVAFPSGSQYTFNELFKNNTHLISAENLILPATTSTSSCYSGMFYGCTSLIAAPELPATKLYSYCYSSMFQGCTSLTTAPELPATTLKMSCYYHMFENCNKLNSITMLATDISASGCLSIWVRGVSSTGTFTKASSMTTLPTGNSGVPSGWTVVDYGAA